MVLGPVGSKKGRPGIDPADAQHGRADELEDGCVGLASACRHPERRCVEVILDGLHQCLDAGCVHAPLRGS